MSTKIKRMEDCMSFAAWKDKSNRTLLIQLVFTALAFLIMAVLSYMFMSSTVHDSLVRHASGVINLTQDRISSNLYELESTVSSFSSEARDMIIRGDDVQAMQHYIDDITKYNYLDGKEESGIQDFFGYFESFSEEPVLIHSGSSSYSESLNPEEQSWYQLAIEANGGVAQTVPVIVGEDTLYTYSKAIFDDSGKRLGVVCLNVKIELMGNTIIETALNQGGYGMLINQNGLVMFHPNTEFRGLYMVDPKIPFSSFASEVVKGDVSERTMVTYMDETAVAFFRTLENGWYLGLVTPQEQYYESISNMGIIIALLATVLASILIGILIRLDSARTKSDEESRQKSMFLANMSHEIRTPINAIVGMTAIGKAAGAVERKDYCFTKIDDASRHLLGVINDILDISKIEANKIELSPTDFIFEKMLQQVVNVVNFRVDEKHQKLTVYIDETIPKVLFADDQRFSQVITNLLSNAVKFTPDGGAVSLKTKLLGEAKGVYDIQVEITDNGIGMSPEQQSKLFQSFQQAESSTTRKYGGTGLGLAISKNIVKLMDGEIGVTSEMGKGSTFTFNVKAQRGDESKFSLVDYGVNWGNIKILTVDDDRDILDYFHEIVKGFGANCEIAESAGDALQLVDENGSYNIYFVDFKMPGVDGIALTREIKAREKEPGHSIVIMISSADLSSVENEAKKAGVDKFLLKPIFPSAIADAINECIGIVNQNIKDAPTEIDGLFKGKHVLFAEDVEINREIVEALLEPTNVDLDSAENGVEVVRKFVASPDKYDMIFMDVQMPQMDGYEATRQIRALDIPKAKEIPIVAMTANVFKEDVDRCIAAGMNDHLAKPLDIDALIGMMTRYLGETTKV